MHRANCKLESISPYLQQRSHWNESGHVCIPPMSFKNCLSEAVLYKAGKSTYTKHFLAGVLVADALELPVTKDTMQYEWLYVPSDDGYYGGITRVEECFPLIPSWSGVVEFLILDEIIAEEVFHEHLVDAGSSFGIGFRPRNNDFYGRFEVKSVQWS